MLYLSTKLYNLPLLSLRSTGRIGTVLRPIVNPHNLHIDGFYCQTPHARDNQILLDIHIRDLSPRGIIIDDHQTLSAPDELVRLQSVLKINFKVEDKVVVAGNKKLGKVTDYAIDQKSLFIQKLYVQPSIWRGISQNRLTFDRASVIEVTDTQIIVSGPEEKSRQSAANKPAKVQAGYSSASSSLTNE